MLEMQLVNPDDCWWWLGRMMHKEYLNEKGIIRYNYDYDKYEERKAIL